MKKEKITNVEDTLELDKELESAIRRQYRKSFNDLQTARENKIIRDKKRDKILKILIGAVIMATVAFLMFINYRLTTNAQKNCIEAGHSENYCYERL